MKKNFWQHTMRAVKEADIIVHVLDARLPELTRSPDIEKTARHYGKDIVYVLNKADLVSPTFLAKSKAVLGDQAIAVSVSKRQGVKDLKERLYTIARRRGKHEDDGAKVCFVGYPNVGKSSIINILARRARTHVSAKAGTTRGVQWVNMSWLKFLDSPGVIPIHEFDERMLALMSAKNPEDLKKPEQTAFYLLNFFKEISLSTLEKVCAHYRVPYHEDLNEIFLAIGKRNHFLVKGGEIDTRRTALTLVRDWQRGRLRV